MRYAKIDFLIVIFSIITLTMMFINVALLSQTHFHREYLGNYISQKAETFFAKVKECKRS